MTRWRDHAACIHHDPEDFFPVMNAPDNRGRRDEDTTAIREAKQICNGCPVRTACLEHSLTTGDVDWGIRGAMTPTERRAARRNQRTHQ